MQPFLFKPNDYATWSSNAIGKIEKTINSCKTNKHLEVAQVMVDNFIMILVLNDQCDQEIVNDISRQLYLSLKLKEKKLFK